MSRTYALLLRLFPKRLASALLVLWYFILITSCLYYLSYPMEEIIYWDKN